MNTSHFAPMDKPVNGLVDRRGLPARITHWGESTEAQMKPEQAVKYFVGALTAGAVALLAVGGLPTAKAEILRDTIALALLVAGVILAIIWIVRVLHKLPGIPRKKRRPSSGKPTKQPQSRPPEDISTDPNLLPAPPGGASAPVPMAPRPALVPTPAHVPSPDPDTPQRSDMGDSGRIPAVAPYQVSQFLNDPLFILEDPRPRARLFQAPKDKDNLCQDSFSCDQEREIYVVTDGVAGSQMSAPWARIVAREYVKFKSYLQDPFEHEEGFTIWLSSCMHQWRDWMYDTRAWRLGTIDSRAQNDGSSQKKSIDYWHDSINSKPAQTTIVTCSIQHSASRRDMARLRVRAVGDADCLVFRREKNGMLALQWAFPLDDPKQFNDYPDTLSSDWSGSRFHSMFMTIRQGEFDVKKDDVVVLATDSVAKWLLELSLSRADASVAPQTFDMRELLSLTDQAMFASVVERECAAHRLERDDETLLIIPIS